MDSVQTLTSIAVPAHGLCAGSAAPCSGGEFITFRLGEEDYGIHTLSVQEIRSYEPPTRIANAPAYLRGVIDLRGVIVPIVDLRIKLGCTRTALCSSTVVMVLKLGDLVVGLVVDAVTEVLQIAATDMRPAPVLGGGAVDTRFILGMGTIEDRLLILMDIDRWLRCPDMGLLALH